MFCVFERGNGVLEELLYQELVNDRELGEILSTYGGLPAVFYQKAPSSEYEDWESSCFPRIEFVVDRSFDPERASSGKLWCHLWVSADCVSSAGGNLEREMEEIMKKKLDGTFFRKNQVTTCASWLHSNTYRSQVNKKSMETSVVETFGITMEFDLLDFYPQCTSRPDPVEGANAWLKKRFSSLIVLGVDEIPPVWKPLPHEVAVYWRFLAYEGDMRQGFSVNWYLGKLALHLFSGSLVNRNACLKSLVEALQVDGEILLSDKSPMFVKKLQVNHGGDPLREGQLLLLGEYGVLLTPKKLRPSSVLERVHWVNENAEP